MAGFRLRQMLINSGSSRRFLARPINSPGYTYFYKTLSARFRDLLAHFSMYNEQSGYWRFATTLIGSAHHVLASTICQPCPTEQFEDLFDSDTQLLCRFNQISWGIPSYYLPDFFDHGCPRCYPNKPKRSQQRSFELRYGHPRKTCCISLKTAEYGFVV